jgi:hypothetical protein
MLFINKNDHGNEHAVLSIWIIVDLRTGAAINLAAIGWMHFVCFWKAIYTATVGARFRLMRGHLAAWGDCATSPEARRVSWIWRNPDFVTRKYRFALPPGSGVESPSLDVTRPLAASRSRAA